MMEHRKIRRALVHEGGKNATRCCDDAFSYLECMPPHEFDAIITDPPYQIGIAGQKWDSKPLPIDWLAYHFHRVLKPNGNVFVFCSDFQFVQWYTELSKYFTNLRKYAWCRSNPMGWIKGRFIESFELGLHACGPDAYFDKSRPYKNHKVTGTCAGRERIKPDADEEKGKGKGQKSLHPTQKPLELIEELVTALTDRGHLILDPFSGTGTLAEAAMNLGRRYTVVEFKYLYYKAASRRLKSQDLKST